MKIIRRILLVVCLAVFLYSAGNLLNIGYKYHKLDSDNNKLQEKVVTEVKQDSPLDRKIDFNQLKSINEDIIGWIYIPNTNIDYALLKGKTNDTYIHTNYEKKYSFGGSIFLDEDNNASLTDSNTIIYGHNMKNGAMFANIKKFAIMIILLIILKYIFIYQMAALMYILSIVQRSLMQEVIIT